MFRRLITLTLATLILAGGGATAAQARPVPEDDRGNCRPGYHLVGATCFPNVADTRTNSRKGASGRF